MARIHCNCRFFNRFFQGMNKARKDVPVVFEAFVVVVVLCLLLLIDIIWLGHVHSKELTELDELHLHDLQRFRKQYDVQMHAINSQHKKLGSDLNDAHSNEVNRLKLDHQQELDSQIETIQEQLNSLKSLSKSYWEKHAKQHQIEIGFNPPEFGEDVEEK